MSIGQSDSPRRTFIHPQKIFSKIAFPEKIPYVRFFLRTQSRGAAQILSTNKTPVVRCVSATSYCRSASKYKPSGNSTPHSIFRSVNNNHNSSAINEKLRTTNRTATVSYDQITQQKKTTVERSVVHINNTKHTTGRTVAIQVSNGDETRVGTPLSRSLRDTRALLRKIEMQQKLEKMTNRATAASVASSSSWKHVLPELFSPVDKPSSSPVNHESLSPQPAHEWSSGLGIGPWADKKYMRPTSRNFRSPVGKKKKKIFELTTSTLSVFQIFFWLDYFLLQFFLTKIILQNFFFVH